MMMGVGISRPLPRLGQQFVHVIYIRNAVYKLHEVNTADVQNDTMKYLREALPDLQDEPEL